MLIVALAHPIDVTAHPTCPVGWRWAVHIGTDYADIGSCLNAGWEPSEYQARLAAEQAAVCAHKVALRFDPSAGFESVVLSHDPVPSAADDLPLLHLEA